MATTRLIALHVNKGKTVAQCLNERLDYSQNPVKTEKGELISSYACDPETSAMKFLLSKRQYQQVTGRSTKEISSPIRSGSPSSRERSRRRKQTGSAMSWPCASPRGIMLLRYPLIQTEPTSITTSFSIPPHWTAAGSSRTKNYFFSGIALQRFSDIVCFEHGYSIIERKPYADRTKRTEYPKRHTVRNETRSVLDDLIRRKPKDWEEFIRAKQNADVILNRYASEHDVQQRSK